MSAPTALLGSRSGFRASVGTLRNGFSFALDGLASRGIYAITSFIFVTQRASWTRSRDDVSGEDQREVRKRLWEVSELALQPRIVLLREKPQVIS